MILNVQWGADLIRILSIALVAWFQYRQQSWLSAGKTGSRGVYRIYLGGYSLFCCLGSCLFLPYAVDYQKEWNFKNHRDFIAVGWYFACIFSVCGSAFGGDTD